MDGHLTVAKSRRVTSRRRRRVLLTSATAADHVAIHHFLTAVFQGPSQAEYQASLDDPFYEPGDRLLLRRDSTILGHALVTHRSMQFAAVNIPVGGLHWLGVGQQWRGQGQGGRLLQAAEEHMVSQGAQVGLVRTTRPEFFQRAGWIVIKQQRCSQASTRDLLSVINTRTRRHMRKRLNIRLWRQVELAALMRIHQRRAEGTCGPIVRSEAYWRWLIQHAKHDRIYVALDGPDLLEIEENKTPIVGYAVTRGDRIIELCTEPDHPRADIQLLARVCADAIESDHHCVTLATPSHDRLHKLFTLSGGTRQSEQGHGNELLMAKIFSIPGLLDALGGELHQRASIAGLKRPADLGVMVGKKKFRLHMTSQGVQVIARSLGRSYIETNPIEFMKLLLGETDWERVLEHQQGIASTQVAQTAAAALFPRLPVWHPGWDDLSGKQ